MILYKYVSYEIGKKILAKNSIGFSQPRYFNDPFDLPSYPEVKNSNPVENIFEILHVFGKNHIWSENTGILSSTRTPTNPLMWAHYADGHKGMVIGIDVNLAGFTSEKYNLIPAQYGNVIYVSERSEEPFQKIPETAIADGATYYFPQDHYEKLQRLFLYKSICWAYEEEVRIVKCIKGINAENQKVESGIFDIISVNDRDLYLFNLPEKAIQEVYFGFRSDSEKSDKLYYQIKEHHPQISVYECNLNTSNLTVGYGQYHAIGDD